MKKAFLAPIFLAPLLLAGCSHPHPGAYYPPPPTASQVARQGFHNGFDAARRDVASGRPPLFDRHPRFRNPPVPLPAVEEYRQAFRNGYEKFLHPTPPSPPGI